MPTLIDRLNWNSFAIFSTALLTRTVFAFNIPTISSNIPAHNRDAFCSRPNDTIFEIPLHGQPVLFDFMGAAVFSGKQLI
jgi:hypothetical protein